jgi:hypothetical protein
MNNSAKTWPLQTVARAADVDPSCLRQWFGTGTLHLRGNDKKSTGTGHKVGLSRERAIEAAIVQQLNRHGVMVSRGANAAFEFTINSNAELFPLGKTILTIGPDGAAVRNVDHTAPFHISSISNHYCTGRSG